MLRCVLDTGPSGGWGQSKGSPATSTPLRCLSPNDRKEARDLAVASNSGEAQVIFGDGIEGVHLSFDWGVTAQVRVAAKQLGLVSG